MKTKTEKIILSGLIILILSVFAIEASAFRGGSAGVGIGDGQGRTGGKRYSQIERQWWRNDEISEKISLTKEQKNELETLYKGQRLSLIDLRAEQKKTMILFEDALDSEFSEHEANEKLIRVLDAKRDLETERMKHLIKVRKVLSLDQFRKLKEYGKLRVRERKRRQSRSFQQPRLRAFL